MSTPAKTFVSTLTPTMATLRDELAGKAMQGDWASKGWQLQRFTSTALVDLAVKYYEMADAMLVARDARKV